MKYLIFLLLFQCQDPYIIEMGKQISYNMQQTEQWNYRLKWDIQKLNNTQYLNPMNAAYVEQVVRAISYDQGRILYYQDKILSLQNRIKQHEYAQKRKVQSRRHP